MQRANLVGKLYANPKSKDSHIYSLNTTRQFPGDSLSVKYRKVASMICQAIENKIGAKYMFLSVITDEPIEEVKAFLETKFSNLKKGVNQGVFEDINPHEGEYTGQVVRYTTNRQRTDRNSRERTLTIGYWLPKELSYLNNYKTNSLRLIEAELCEESPNTFLDNIKKYVTQENGIANCGAVFDYTAQYSPFTIELQLTKFGFANIETIMDTFFLYLKVIMSTEYEKMFFEEHKKISQLKFYWNTENDILYEAQTLSEALRKKDELSIDNIFNFNQVLFDYNQEEVDHILDYFFTPSNMLLVIGGSLNDWKTLVFEQYEKDAYATDKHTKTLSDRQFWSQQPLQEYHQDIDVYSDNYTFPTNWTTRWQNMDYLTSYCKNVGIIPFKTEDTPMYWIPQEYIIKTDCMEYFEIIYENDTKYKEECFEEERLCDLICTPKKKAPGIYWKPNRYFDRPYVTIDIIGTPASQYLTTASGVVAVDIAETSILKIQQNYSIATDIGFKIFKGNQGDQTIDIRIDGYGSKTGEFYKEIRQYSVFRTDSDINKAGKKEVRDHYLTRNVQVDKQAESNLMRIISSSSLFTFQERIDQIDSVTDQQIDDILTSLREDNHAARVLFFGNLNEDTSEYFDEAHRVYNDSEIFKYSLSPNFKPAYAYTFKLQNSNSSIKDAGIASYYYCGERTVRNYALAEALVYVWEQMTELQGNGFVDFTVQNKFQESIGIQVSVIITKPNQGNTQIRPFDVDKQIEKELKQLGAKIESITQAEIFNIYDQKRQKANEYERDFKNYRDEVYKRVKYSTTPDWDWSSDLVDAYQKINKEDLLVFYDTYFYREVVTEVKDCRKATVWIYPQNEGVETSNLLSEDTSCLIQTAAVNSLDDIRNNLVTLPP